MTCEACKQREATILFTQISGDEKKTLRLCPQCASTRAQQFEGQSTGDSGSEGSPNPDTKSSEVEAPNSPKKKSTIKKVNVVVGHLSSAEGASSAVCGQCGLTYEEFRKVGRFGCQVCYEAFALQLERLFKRIHGATRHGGKGPQAVAKPVNPGDELETLRQALCQAVADEAYEKAAEIRDRIAQLESTATDIDDLGERE